MPRVTMKMLQEQIDYLNKELTWRDHKIELLEMQVKMLNNPVTVSGQLTVMVIALERITEATAHVLSDLKKKS